MNRPDVSVIIPVFRAEPYIEKCVLSLYQQTHHGLEFIFVDDCSPDNSIAVIERLLEQFPERSSQTKIIRHKENVGVSQSRQDATDLATGEYIIHCDPDDWVEPQMYERLYEEAKAGMFDVVVCDFAVETLSGTSISRQRPANNDVRSLIGGISGRIDPSLHGSLCNKLIRRECFDGVEFPKGINYCEDVAVLFQILSRDRRIGYVDRAFYHYEVDVAGSIVKSVDRKALDMDMRLISFLLALMSDVDEEYNAGIYSMIVNVIFGRAFMAGNVDRKRFRRDYSHLIKRYLKYNRSIKQPFRLLLVVSGAGAHNVSMGVLRWGRRAKSIVRRVLGRG